MKVVSWNVNGVQGFLKKDRYGDTCSKMHFATHQNAFEYFMEQEDPDILCLQEIRCSDAFRDNDHFSKFPYRVLNYAKSRGYAGTAIFSKIKPLNTYKDFEYIDDGTEINHHRLVNEGRLVTFEFSTWFCVCIYSPYTGQKGVTYPSKKLLWRVNRWEPHLRVYLSLLRETGKSVVAVGDLNVTASPMDITLPYTPKAQAAERTEFEKLLKCGFRDTFRDQNPDVAKYSWPAILPEISQDGRKCIEYRLDYILTAGDVVCERSDILDYKGSDHLPVVGVVNV